MKIQKNLKIQSNQYHQVIVLTLMTYLYFIILIAKSIKDANECFIVDQSNIEENDFKFISLYAAIEYKMRPMYVKSPVLFYMHLETSTSKIAKLSSSL